MIPAFTPHADTGQYHYPLEREAENPFQEAEVLFKAKTVETTLLGTRISKSYDLFLGWLLVQYLTNPIFRQKVPSFQPNMEVEAPLRLHLGVFKKQYQLRISPSRSTLLAGFNLEWVAEQPQVRKYLTVLKTKSPLPPLRPGELPFTFNKTDEGIPAGTKMILNAPQLVEEHIWADGYYSYVQRQYLVYPANRPLCQRLLRKIKFDALPELPSPTDTLEEQLTKLRQMPPTSEAEQALQQVLAQIGQFPSPTNFQELLALSLRLRRLYSCFYGEETIKKYNVGHPEPFVCPITKVKTWIITNQERLALRANLGLIPALQGPVLLGFDNSQISLNTQLAISSPEGTQLFPTPPTTEEWKDIFRWHPKA